MTEIKTRNNSVLIAGFRLNNIREINNAKGRSYTDYIIIKQIARKLFDNMGDFVEFYRLDGVTFMAIADMDNKNTKTIIVEAIRNIIESCYVDNDISVRNPVSVATIEHPRDLLSNAEIIESLQSLSKAAKGNPDLKFMDYSSENIEKLREKSNTALALNYDVMNGMKNFRIMIQPIISTESSKILSGEVLLRWTYDGRDIPPSVFVPLLEDEKIIHIVGRWVVEQAALCASKLESDGIDIRLGFNVSMYQLSDEKLRPFISEMLRKYRIDGNKLVAEITESCMADNPKELEEFIDFCVSEHIWLALDDFGSGYSSLRMLLQYPFNVVKMDKSLIEEIDRSEKVPNFIRNIVASCHELGKTVCAEGIESKSVFDAVKQTGCDTMQGYFFFRPLEIETLFRIIKENDKNIEVTCK